MESQNERIVTIPENTFEYLVLIAGAPFIIIITICIAVWGSGLWAVVAALIGPSMTLGAARAIKGAIT